MSACGLITVTHTAWTTVMMMISEKISIRNSLSLLRFMGVGPVQMSTGKEISVSECTFSVGSMRSGSAAASPAAAGVVPGLLAGASLGVPVAALPGAAGDAGAGLATAGGSAAEPLSPAANHSN